MAKDQNKDHAGSGIDKPDPKTVLERTADMVKSVIPTTSNAAPEEPKEPDAPSKSA